MKERSVFLAWLGSRWKSALVGVLVFALARFVFFLYKVPAEPLVYSFVLSLAFILVYGAFCYSAFLSRIKTLRRLREEILFTTEHLPEPADECAREYDALIRILSEAKNEIKSKGEAETTDIIEYYTMWVHQIKTPIAAMRLLLQSRTDVPGAELEIELIKIEQYVEMVLQYLRLDSSANDIVLTHCDLDGIIRRAIRKYARLFIGKKLSLDFEPTGYSVLTDEKWLLFVIEQILSNALKYTPRDGKITIKPGRELSLIISDTGIGIAPEDLPRVCEKGYTGYNGRLDKKSTGIGLYLCKRIVAMIGHTMTIESETSKGTAVTLGLAQSPQVYE